MRRTITANIRPIAKVDVQHFEDGTMISTAYDRAGQIVWQKETKPTYTSWSTLQPVVKA